MGKTQQQETQVMARLAETKKMTLAEARTLLNISESTARRIFTRLEAQGRVLRSHGAIQPPMGRPPEYSFEQMQGQNTAEKRRIGVCAARLVESGDILFLDSGTTLTHFCLALLPRLEAGEVADLQVFTNSLAVLNLLHKQAALTLIGGAYRSHREDFCGYVAEETLKGLHFSKCFLGADGYSLKNGFTCMEFNTARLCELAMAGAKENIILADADKFDVTAVVGYAGAVPVHRVITDRMPAQAVAAHLDGQGIRLVIAP